ncbi:myosin-IIIa-like [Ptychodera flava]|uniref:myosin-IIIa-like n=1 Tax=Ptychodera flava TaxID=63121 RepID=UPI00396A215A
MTQSTREQFNEIRDCLRAVGFTRDRHSGILAILGEESHFPQATDKSLATKLHSGPGKTGNTVYFAPKDDGVSFAIMHYAGKVTYNLVGVLNKNRDTLPNSIQFTMKTSSSLLIKRCSNHG